MDFGTFSLIVDAILLIIGMISFLLSICFMKKKKLAKIFLIIAFVCIFIAIVLTIINKSPNKIHMLPNH